MVGTIIIEAMQAQSDAEVVYGDNISEIFNIFINNTVNSVRCQVV